MNDLTIRRAQCEQPWTVPYSQGVRDASVLAVPHILGTHAVLHATKTVGRLAAVFEALDHPVPRSEENRTAYGPSKPSDHQLETIKAMSADLMVIALRLANLYDFDLQSVLVMRVQQKNGVGYSSIEPHE